MSQTLVDHSPDLTRLVQESYDIEIRGSNLLVHHVPFVNSTGTVEYGILISELSTNAERTIKPGRHEMWLVGGVPYDHLGRKVSVVNSEVPTSFGPGLVAACSMSAKVHSQPPEDYYDKVVNYVGILSSYARGLDPSATHANFPVRESTSDESVFCYHDSFTSRAGLSAVSEKLQKDRVAIVGLGGTGSYTLDLVAKTPVEEIHLYDDDVLYAHNAFRAPGAASLDELRSEPHKVTYFAAKYEAIRRNIFPHPVKVTEGNIGEITSMTFVFLALDAGPTKQMIVKALESANVPFVDSSMGVQRKDDSLRGVLQVTTGSKGRYSHISKRISFVDVNANEYDWNIQTADLNMMNASMAVIKWKKMRGYYADDKREFNSTYTVTRNQMISGEVAD